MAHVALAMKILSVETGRKVSSVFPSISSIIFLHVEI